MEELSKQFVDIVRTHLDGVGIPITNCNTTYNTSEHDDKQRTSMYLRIQVGDTSDPHDKTEIAIDRIGGMSLTINIISEMMHDGVLMRRIDKRFDDFGNHYVKLDSAVLERVDEEIKRALPTIETSIKDKTLDWMVPKTLHNYLSVNLDNTYGEYRKDAQLDNESRVVESYVESRGPMAHWNSIRSMYEVCGYKDRGDDTNGSLITRMAFETHTTDPNKILEATCKYWEGDTVTVQTDTYDWSRYGKARIESGSPVATADVALEEFRTTMQQKLEQRRTIADAIELPNEPQL